MLSRFILSFFFIILIISFFKIILTQIFFKCLVKVRKITLFGFFPKKRKQVILTSINNTKTKINFRMERQTDSAFLAKGVLSDLNTSVNFDEKTRDLAMLQTSLRGSNQFYKCSTPKLIKEE